jgi:hypothetical protein
VAVNRSVVVELIQAIVPGPQIPNGAVVSLLRGLQLLGRGRERSRVLRFRSRAGSGIERTGRTRGLLNGNGSLRARLKIWKRTLRCQESFSTRESATTLTTSSEAASSTDA